MGSGISIGDHYIGRMGLNVASNDLARLGRSSRRCTKRLAGGVRLILKFQRGAIAVMKWWESDLGTLSDYVKTAAPIAHPLRIKSGAGS